MGGRYIGSGRLRGHFLTFDKRGVFGLGPTDCARRGV